MVFESTFDSLADYERAAKALMAKEEWRAWYPTVVPLVEGGRREIFTVVE